MKNLVILVLMLSSFLFADAQKKSLYRTVADSTNSGVSEGSLIPDSQRPKGFIIRVGDYDKDKDGVENRYDECPNTLPGKVVDEKGCMIIIRLNIQFAFDKSDIREDFKDEIAQAVKFLQENENFTTTVEGHTDSVGTHEYNYDLSFRRANKTKIAILEEGIDERRILAEGYGETVPVAKNDSEEGRAKNRRVDISFNK